MRGLVLDAARLAFRDDLPEPVPRPGHTIVRVVHAGICATDLALANGYMGFRGVPGHEFVGVAEDGPLVGQRVVGDINAACGECEVCLPRDGSPGDSHHCPHRTVLGILGHSGAFAERLQLPDRNLLAVPDTVSDAAATFTEPVAAAFEIPTQLDLARGTRALVVGDGKLGLLCANVLALAGCEVTVAGRHASRTALLPSGVEFLERAFEADSKPIDRRFQLAVEATGHAAVLPRLLAAVEPRGTIVLKTTTERLTEIDLAPLVVDEITLVGSRCGPFGRALEALASHSIPVEHMVETTYPMAEGEAAFGHAARAGVLKVLLRP